MTAQVGAGDEQEEPDPAGLLLDLPAPLWGELLRALRRAVDRLPRAQLPVALRPYAGWTPESLGAPRPRKAIARAVVSDPRLREQIGAAMEDAGALAAAADTSGTRLVEDHGEETAVAALVARARWEDLAVVAAAAAERRASQDRSAAEASGAPHLGELQEASRRLRADLNEARDERDAHRRRADAAEERARRSGAARREVEAETATLCERVAKLEAQLVEERRQRDRRVARLQRRLEEAEARARVDEARAARVVGELERLAVDLREALGPPPSAGERQGVALPPPEAAAPAIPRVVAAAAAGRPCRLPPGVAGDSPAAVEALLQVPGLVVVLDGYNVTKDVRGRPRARLADQRHWLVKLAGGVAARYGRRLMVVFDGTDEHAGPPPAARGVGVLFTAGEEIADERIAEIVADLGPRAPALVVSSDREVQDAAEDLGANVATAGVFLTAVGA
ncbi:MAG TPA: NYN domain-containing protein [Egibacteraceae bacterium]|jgi:predicted RNA-binding protein with PIN domain|nr:NYN domain-containing protein [Egibacteraceae bacterium]